MTASGGTGSTAHERMLEILRGNVGFDDPAAWVPYGLAQALRPVRVRLCPGCGAAGAPALGQYIYYSTLHRLRECTECGLIYADARLDPAVVQRHFEAQYKDEAYFQRARAGIFAQLAGLIDRAAPDGARVLDVSGAKGHLMAAARRRRPDLQCTVNDLSRTACNWAAAEYGLRTICGPITALAAEPAPYDVVVMSDVLYYEPDLAGVWATLPRIVAPSGTLILRVPNRLALLRAGLQLDRLRRGHQVRVWCHNPEHLYVFSRAFLERTLRSAGFRAVQAFPSRLLQWPGVRRIVNRGAFAGARLLAVASRGAALAKPAMLLVASDYQAPGPSTRVAPRADGGSGQPGVRLAEGRRFQSALEPKGMYAT